MGSQYLIKQHLHTQPGGRDVHLTVHSTDWHTSRSLITCGDAVHIHSQLGQQAGATASANPPTDPVTVSVMKHGFKKIKNPNSKAFRHKPEKEYSSFCDRVLYFKPFAGGYIYLHPNLWQFLLRLSVASVSNRITGDLVNLCFNVREPAALGSEHFNCP